MADAQELTLEILTPTGPISLDDSKNAEDLVQQGARMSVPGVELPGVLGEFGILPGHIPFISPIKPGLMRFRSGGKDYRLAVSDGLVEVSEGGAVTVLTDRALQASEIDRSEVKSERDAAAKELAAFKDSTDAPGYRALQRRLDWADAQLRAAS